MSNQQPPGALVCCRCTISVVGMLGGVVRAGGRSSGRGLATVALGGCYEQPPAGSGWRVVKCKDSEENLLGLTR